MGKLSSASGFVALSRTSQVSLVSAYVAGNCQGALVVKSWGSTLLPMPRRLKTTSAQPIRFSEYRVGEGASRQLILRGLVEVFEGCRKANGRVRFVGVWGRKAASRT